ncbi:MAG: MFS transporter, partial [Candidatus Protistobacter heckmanni]|nr:MFS transporter [Candidatus Protistobacter heckmanni]
GVRAVDLSAGMTSYLVTLAVLIPVSSWTAERFGTREVFGWAIAVFTFASVLCGLAQTAEQFTLARILQGAGGAMMVPVGRLAALRGVEKKDLMRTIAFITWPGLVAPVIGPPLGGLITAYASWRWIFLLNVPLGIAGFFLVRAHVRNHGVGQKRPFDAPGFVLSGAALAAVMVGLELVGREGSLGEAGLYLLAGLVLGVIAVWHARRAAHPMLDFSVLRIPTFRVTVFSGTLSRIGISVTPFLAPLMFQQGFGLNAFQSGLLFLAAALGNIGMKPMTSAVLRRFGFRNVSLGNLLVVGAATFACGLLAPDTAVPLILMTMAVYGLSRSMQFTALVTLAFADVPADKMSNANILFNTVFQLAMGLRVAAGALALHVAVWLHGGDAAKPHAADFSLAFMLTAALILISLGGYWRLRPDAGAQVSGHKAGEPSSAR